MNNAAYREFGFFFFLILLFIAIILYFFRLKATAIFFLIFSTLIGIGLLISPFAYKRKVKQNNFEISGIYSLSFIDSTSKYEMRNFKISDSCKMILYPTGRFHIQNCPQFIEDSIGSWTWCSDGNYFGVCFADLHNKGINSFRSDLPYKEIEISKTWSSSGITKTAMIFSKANK